MEQKKKTIKDLNREADEAKSCDKDLRSEQRTNIQLVSGDHYNRYGSRYWNRLREAKQVSPEVRLRLTKNHIGKITKIYRNEIQRHSPGVVVTPKNEKELQDQKAAELHNSVWQDIKNRHEINRYIRTWIKDFIEIGEVCCKVFWDPDAGHQIGWDVLKNEEGQPIPHPLTGGYQQDPNSPIMAGDLVFETIHGFDLGRDPGVKHMNESPYLIYQKMAPIRDLQAKYQNDSEKSKFIKESSADTFRVFEGNSSSYKEKKDMVLVREHYYRPCADYPGGYYYICTENGILEEGELPFKIFPIIYEGFDEVTTSPRHHSIIKQLRPYQIEINRMASKAAEIQVTLGSDRVYSYSGSKPSSGVSRPGVRHETISGIGMEPKVIPGSVGEQYFQAIKDQIAEMYQIADVSEELEEIPAQVDPYALLFRSLKQKKKFVIYAEKFEGFLTKVCWTSLRLMKKYASQELFISAVGKNEQINIQEFKNSDDLGWQIVVEPQSDDIETKVGKQLALNTIIQYIGPQLQKDEAGKFIRLSPYLNKEKMLEDMTLDYDNAVNDILALDRGQYPQPVKYENHEYQLGRLTARTKQADYRFKPPYIQSLYDQKISEHEQAIAEEARKLEAAKAGIIPATGAAVACDAYVPDPNNPQSSKRLRVPMDALMWLERALKDQGNFMQGLSNLPNSAVGEIGERTNQGQQPGPASYPIPGVS